VFLCQKENFAIFAEHFSLSQAQLWQLGAGARVRRGTPWSTKVLSERVIDGPST
jgi:hypothetical protein